MHSVSKKEKHLLKKYNYTIKFKVKIQQYLTQFQCDKNSILLWNATQPFLNKTQYVP